MKTHTITIALPEPKCRECELANRVAMLQFNFNEFKKYDRLIELALECVEDCDFEKARDTTLLLLDLYRAQLDWYVSETAIPLGVLQDLVRSHSSDCQQQPHC